MIDPLLVIVGPTCTGKTALAVAAARLLAPAEMINADSRQVRRGLRVGTCAPTADALHGVPCHLLEVCDPGVPYTVADWLRAAGDEVGRVRSRGATAIVCGGTGLYVSALVDGFDLAGGPPDAELRVRRTEQASTASGLAALVDQLTRRDPGAAVAVELRNPRRVVRALEVLDAGVTSAARSRSRRPGHPAVMIGLDVERSAHARWIERRTATMFSDGSLVGEVQALRDGGVSRTTLAASGIGYREAIDLIEGRTDRDTAIAATVRRTLRYAKAQRTWFRRDPRIAWLRSDLAGVDTLATEVARRHRAADG